MTPLEIRIIAYAVLLGLFAWGVHTLDAHHYERVQASDKAALAAAYQTQQQKTIDDLKAQQATTQAAEKQYADLKSHSDGLAQQLGDSVSNYASLRRGIMSTASSAAALADAARQGTQRDSELAGLVRQATSACEGDAAELTALQTWSASK